MPKIQLYTMIWLNFKGWDGKFSFDLHSHNILSFKKLFHPSLATYYANSLCYGILNNQKKDCQVELNVRNIFTVLVSKVKLNIMIGVGIIIKQGLNCVFLTIPM